MTGVGDCHRWYTDPLEPGAPQVGDLVVVVHALWTSANGTIGHILTMDTPKVDRHPWRVIPGGWASHVRRPTEAELAAWVLSQDDGLPRELPHAW